MIAAAASYEADVELNTRRARILSLCCLYPNPLQPNQGIFVQRRLQHLAELADLRVVSPFAVVQYGNPPGKRLRVGERGCPPQRMDGVLQVAHPRWFYPPLSGSFIPFWLASQLYRTVARIHRDFPFEIIDTHFGFPDGIAGAMCSSALGIPFTMTLRGNEPKHSQSRLGRWLMGQALRRASAVFPVSERLRRFAISLGADPDRVRTIPNGVDGDTFYPRDRRACRVKHGFPLDTPLILSAGALVERKGHHRIIEALRHLAPARLAIAGGPGPEGQYENRLRGQVRDSGLESSVRFLGAVPPETLAEWMSAADVFCLASTNEGWPNVVHEALACGTPVVATDVGAIPEMLAGGHRGLVVPVNQLTLLTKALGEALGKDWNREAISAWGRARCWRQVAAEVYQAMQKIVVPNR
jgi:teichuronic acid biosynthesis glycosyltransferase TuaC